MQAIKLTFLILLVTLAVAAIGSVAYVEFFIVPAMLSRHLGQFATLVHLLSIIVLMFTVAGLTIWFRDRTIFKIQEILVSSYLEKLMESITHLTTGRWSSDSYTHNEAFKTGAKLGFGMGYKVGEAGEVDRRAILEGISRMQLPAGEQSAGQPASLVDDMATYLDELDSRKRRLSGS